MILTNNHDHHNDTRNVRKQPQMKAFSSAHVFHHITYFSHQAQNNYFPHIHVCNYIQF